MQIIATAYRGNIPDLLYTGHVAVCDYTGKLLCGFGDPHRITFARSSMKPISTMPVIETGAADAYHLTDSELSLISASHSGEPYHVEDVRGILQKAGLDESYLKCGWHYPSHQPSADALREKGQQPTEVHCNCSGKHSGMLLTTKHMGDSLHDYFELDHPTQQRILDYVSDVCEYSRDKIVLGIDGCGVPVHALPLHKMAYAFARIARPETFGGGVRSQSAKRVRDAMRAYPKMMSGTGRLCARLMESSPQIIAKSGADGFYAVGVTDLGIGVSLKIDCGLVHIRDAVVVEALRLLGVLGDDVMHNFEKERHVLAYNNKKEVIGETKVQLTLSQNP